MLLGPNEFEERILKNQLTILQLFSHIFDDSDTMKSSEIEIREKMLKNELKTAINETDFLLKKGYEEGKI